MADDMGGGGGAEQIAQIMSELAEVLGEDNAKIKLHGGREIVGPVLGFNIRRKEKKGDVTWSGSLRVQIDTGELEIDCDNIETVTG